jgi:hypothetical protein
MMMDTPSHLQATFFVVRIPHAKQHGFQSSAFFLVWVAWTLECISAALSQS